MDENVDYEERESEFDLEDEDKSVQMNEDEKAGHVSFVMVFVLSKKFCLPLSTSK